MLCEPDPEALEEVEDLPVLLAEDLDEVLPEVDEPAPVFAEVLVPVFPVVDFEAEVPALVVALLDVEPEALPAPEELPVRPEVPELLLPVLEEALPWPWEPVLPVPMLA